LSAADLHLQHRLHAEDANFTASSASSACSPPRCSACSWRNSLLLLFICWELVGLASYLLIGFWFHKPEAAAAAKKAFITTRIGDLGLLLGMLWLYDATARCSSTMAARACSKPVPQRAGRANHGGRARRFHRDRAADFLRCRRKVRPVSAARLAARCDGGPDARLGAHPRRDHGRRRRFPDRARVSADGAIRD
jgi:hypothetical protein